MRSFLTIRTSSTRSIFRLVSPSTTGVISTVMSALPTPLLVLYALTVTVRVAGGFVELLAYMP